MDYEKLYLLILIDMPLEKARATFEELLRYYFERDYWSLPKVNDWSEAWNIDPKSVEK